MLADDIYSVHFETLAGEGDGVVVVTGEKICGGDATFAPHTHTGGDNSRRRTAVPAPAKNQTRG